MEITLFFDQDGHRYSSPDTNGKWTSVTSVVESLHEPFDAIKMSEHCARKGKGHYYGKTAAEIREMWDSNADYSRDLGTWFHSKTEADLIAKGVAPINGKMLKVFAPPAFVSGTRIAPRQVLEDGIYPEHLCYDEELLVCGHTDIAVVDSGYLDIYDHKVYTEVKRVAYEDKRMFSPVQNLPDCNIWHCCLQLSMYMRMILRHNPHLKPGKVVLRHVQFHEIQNNTGIREVMFSFGGVNAVPVVKKIDSINLKYLENESLLAIQACGRK